MTASKSTLVSLTALAWQAVYGLAACPGHCGSEDPESRT